jgi:hypothetical protein
MVRVSANRRDVPKGIDGGYDERHMFVASSLTYHLLQLRKTASSDVENDRPPSPMR